MFVNPPLITWNLFANCSESRGRASTVWEAKLPKVLWKQVSEDRTESVSTESRKMGQSSALDIISGRKQLFSNTHSVPWCYFSSVLTEWTVGGQFWLGGQGKATGDPNYLKQDNGNTMDHRIMFCLLQVPGSVWFSLHISLSFLFSTFSPFWRFNLFPSLTSVSSSSVHKFLFSEGTPQQQFQFCLSSCTPPHTLLLLLIVLPSWTDTASREEAEQP